MEKKIEEGETRYKVTQHPNATVVAFDNRRVGVIQNDTDSVIIYFKKICSKKEAKKRSVHHKVVRGVLKISSVKISREAATLLYHTLHAQLSRPINQSINSSK